MKAARAATLHTRCPRNGGPIDRTACSYHYHTETVAGQHRRFDDAYNAYENIPEFEYGLIGALFD